MNRLFAPTRYARVGDGTLVAAFMNGTDAQSGANQPLCAGVSVAAGVVEPGVRSRIHVLPLVTQITWVNAGKLTIRMKDAGAAGPYTLDLGPEQACITQPGTFLQMLNTGAEPCRVLYIVSPSYVVELGADGSVQYDDAITFDGDWQALAAAWQSDELRDLEALAARRARALQRLSQRSA